MKTVAVARIAAIPYSILQVLPQVEALVSSGARTSIVCSSPKEIESRLPASTKLVNIRIARDIQPLIDLRSLYSLYRLFLTKRYDVVHSTTPKAGVISAVAARLSGVPVRLHTFTGQPWVTAKGPKRWIMKFCDWLIASLNTHCLVDSESQKQFLLAEGIGTKARLTVLGSGSLCGVDIERFTAGSFNSSEREDLRADLGLPNKAKVILFVGRLTWDKGLRELIEAFNQLSLRIDSARLVIVGPEEEVSKEDLFELQTPTARDRTVFVGSVVNPEHYMAISDVLCLPSYREGFGSVVIEAAAAGITTVASDIYGLSDAVVNGETGILIPPRSTPLLLSALVQVISDDKLRQKLASKAQRRAVDLFSRTRLAELQMKFYSDVINGEGCNKAGYE